ncbi:hypothetical protein TNCV_2169401 [Trichonephila clavipes]|nr:hypothetical protein TNCV_2169401 [Trichonephila clavipes]
MSSLRKTQIPSQVSLPFINHCMKRKAFHPVPRIPTHSYIGYTEAMLKKIEDQNAQLNRIDHLSPHWSSAPEATPPTTNQSLQHQEHLRTRWRVEGCCRILGTSIGKIANC